MRGDHAAREAGVGVGVDGLVGDRGEGGGGAHVVVGVGVVLVVARVGGEARHRVGRSGGIKYIFYTIMVQNNIYFI